MKTEATNTKQLLDYLYNRLSPEQKRNLEEQSIDDHMLSDALEGFQLIEAEKDLEGIKQELNYFIKSKLKKKKTLKLFPVNFPTWILLLILAILLIATISYLLIETTSN